MDDLDWPLLTVSLGLLMTGLVLVASASFDLAERLSGHTSTYIFKQLMFTLVAAVVCFGLWRIPLGVWQRAGGALLMLALLLLGMVLIPGVGREVNGSMRWLSLGSVNLQVSELAKLFVVIYIAGYLVRRGDELANTWMGFIKPLAVLAVFGVLLLQQPDFGTTVVLLATVSGMLFLGGVRLSQFVPLIVAAGGVLVLLVVMVPYRLRRVTSFLDPWAHPFDSGYQLTQALIAFGRGEWVGVGLGGSVQKLAYLPEAHTDFLFAVLAEEGGLVATLTVMGLFAFLVWRAFSIARLAETANMQFARFLAYGIGLLLGLQAFVNMGVNMGVLPTKGLTLPLMSYGGSSLLASSIAITLLLRVHYEVRQALPVEQVEQVRWSRA